VVGFSKLVAEDEAGTLAALREIRKGIVNPVLAEHGGRIFKLMGDGLLAEFPSAVHALHAAIGIQQGIRARNSTLPENQRIEVRIGVHQGDVVVEGSDLLGDGVNIAARLEALAEPGSICISGRVHEDASGKIALQAQNMGEQSLKNIARPVRAYRISLEAAASGDGAGRTSAASGLALPLPDKPSIAVLPFQNMSGDPDQEYFADGMVEDIITGLARIKWLFVIARNSSFVYKGKAVDVKQIGRELGVRYILGGSVRKSGARVRVTSQLLDAATGNAIWSERYDRDRIDIFVVQDEITASVIGAIEPKLLAAEGVRAATRQSGELDAWDKVARALSYFWRFTADDSASAITTLRQAVAAHPDYAPAHSMLACALLISSYVGWTEPGSERDTAARLAYRAVALDDSDSWAYLGLGIVALMGRLPDVAIRYFNAALELNPNFATASGFVGFTLALDGRTTEALAHFERALRTSPRDPFNSMFLAGTAVVHYLEGRYGQAVQWARRAIELRPEYIGGHRILVASLAQNGEQGAAEEALTALRRLAPGISVTLSRLSVPYTERTIDRFVEGLRKAGMPE
jgi:TolB-like protein/class 3 adenylate cyclase/Tfp pilus assembly protein PilF